MFVKIAIDIGTDKLSSIFNGSDSTIVANKTAKIELYKSILGWIRIAIIQPTMKKASDPSRVLLNIFVLPYFLPTSAATVSE
tara:strand:+ start:3870 stop:4115 length:246 start_codon:yes stop_codon:yes gene_type:complete